MNILIIYFSATGVTEKYVQVMKQHAEGIKCVCDTQNIITPKSRQKSINFEQYDGIVFGFPVYSERLPTVVEEWMIDQRINKNMRVTLFFSYGGRGLEMANQISYDLITNAGFSLGLVAELVGAHSFNVGKGWDYASNRPNDEDYLTAKNFIEKSIDFFNGNGSLFQMNAPKFEYQPFVPPKIFGPFYNLLPRRISESCQMCRLCETECPTGAFDADKGIADKEKCIICMGCVKWCPDNVIQTGNLKLIFLMIRMQYRFSKKSSNKKKSRIYSQFPPP